MVNPKNIYFCDNAKIGVKFAGKCLKQDISH